MNHWLAAVARATNKTTSITLVEDHSPIRKTQRKIGRTNAQAPYKEESYEPMQANGIYHSQESGYV